VNFFLQISTGCGAEIKLNSGNREFHKERPSSLHCTKYLAADVHLARMSMRFSVQITLLAFCARAKQLTSKHANSSVPLITLLYKLALTPQ